MKGPNHAGKGTSNKKNRTRQLSFIVPVPECNPHTAAKLHTYSCRVFELFKTSLLPELNFRPLSSLQQSPHSYEDLSGRYYIIAPKLKITLGII